MSIMTDLQMAGETPEAQAKKAIAHVLRRIRDDSPTGWYLGPGTQSYSLLTEAAASLFGDSVETVRKNFQPTKSADPAASVEPLKMFALGFVEHLERMDVVGAFDDVLEFKRLMKAGEL